VLCRGGKETIVLFRKGIQPLNFATTRKVLTIGSDWSIPDWNNDDADGTASKALTMFAPLLCPAIVILDALPPKLGATFFKKFKAETMSFTARFVVLSGAMKPSCKLPREWVMYQK
jgi:hypothetical protein